jgi:hypothetical protein
MAYTKTVWVNGGTPAISETNLNKIETGIKDAHDAIDNIVVDTDSTTNNSNLTGVTLTQALNNTLRDDEVKIGNAVISGDAGINNIAIGKTATIEGSATNDNIVIGSNATTVSGTGTVVIGKNAEEGVGNINVVMGNGAKAGTGLIAATNNSVCLGTNARTDNANTISIGNGAISRGSRSIAIGAESVQATATDSIAIGDGAQATAQGAMSIGFVSTSNANDISIGNDLNHVKIGGNFTVTGTKNFEIPHPNPSKIETHRIRHACVESPTAGDTLYRFTVVAETDGEIVEVQLPDYFEHLNINTDVWVNGKNHFGRAYGQIVADKLIVTCELAGEYNALVIGTRNDDAVQDWHIKGAEREIGESWLGETYAFEVDEIIQVTEIMEV